jgi:hypothetical protein
MLPSLFLRRARSTNPPAHELMQATEAALCRHRNETISAPARAS